MKIIICLMIFIPTLALSEVQAQSDVASLSGIRFIHGLSWRQIREKARTENKFILVDCFATWCAPCKKMDSEVFSNDTVGNAVNSDFLPVKIQMDTSPADNNEIKQWYNDAHALMVQGDIRAFPSFLFFSPDGTLVHKGIGFKSVAEFLTLSANALNPQMQFFTLLNKFREGQADSAGLSRLLDLAEEYGQDTLAARVAKRYLNDVLYTKDQASLLSKYNLIVIWKYAGSSSERGFSLFYAHPHTVDSVVGIEGTAQRLLDRIITAEEIDAPLKSHGNSADVSTLWKQMQDRITQKYDAGTADRIVYSSELRYYKTRKEWRKFMRCFDEKILKSPPAPGTKKFGGMFDDAWELNVNAWTLFLNCKDRTILSAGVKWINMAIALDPEDVQLYDTKANLLYKIGKKAEAISYEQSGLAKAKQSGQDVFVQPYSATIAKMRKNEPTW